MFFNRAQFFAPNQPTSLSPKCIKFINILGGAEEGDGEPDKMAIAFDRIGRFKGYIKSSIANFFRGIKNGIVRAIRGPRGGNGNGSAGADIIALEVTDEKDFQVISFQILLLQNSSSKSITG